MIEASPVVIAHYTFMSDKNLLWTKNYLEFQIRIIDGVEPHHVNNYGKKLVHRAFPQMRSKCLKNLEIIDNEILNRTNNMKLTEEQEIAFHNWIKEKIASKEMTELENGFYIYKGMRRDKFSLQTYFKMETRK